jgi:phenylacetate-coenzyme A ligase PaaK-like adenylate-forming protein
MTVAAELTRDPVRRNWLGQIARYSISVARWRRRLEAWHRDPARYREERLPAAIRETLRAGQTDTAFYPGHFHQAGVQWSDLRTVDDLRHFPALSRRDVQERFHDLVAFSLDGAARDEGIVWRTSGSTGQPVRFFVNGESNKWPLALYRFLMGSGPGRPFSHGIVLLCTLPRSRLVRSWLPLFGGTFFRKLHWSEPGAGETLARLDPRVLTGDPDSLARLDAALASGETQVRPRLILSSAFELPAERSRSLAARTGARVVDCYSIAETGPLAWRCGPERPFHLLGAAAHVETDAAGEILVTNLRNPLFPLIRYRTGDRGEIAWRECDCGYRGPSLVRLSGRSASRFVAASGELVDPSKVEPLLTRLPVYQHQLVQEEGRIVLRYHGPEDVKDVSDLGRALERLLGKPVAVAMERSVEPLWRPGEKPLPYVRRES